MKEKYFGKITTLLLLSMLFIFCGSSSAMAKSINVFCYEGSRWGTSNVLIKQASYVTGRDITISQQLTKEENTYDFVDYYTNLDGTTLSGPYNTSGTINLNDKAGSGAYYEVYIYYKKSTSTSTSTTTSTTTTTSTNAPITVNIFWRGRQKDLTAMKQATINPGGSLTLETPSDVMTYNGREYKYGGYYLYKQPNPDASQPLTKAIKTKIDYNEIAGASYAEFFYIYFAKDINVHYRVKTGGSGSSISVGKNANMPADEINQHYLGITSNNTKSFTAKDLTSKGYECIGYYLHYYVGEDTLVGTSQFTSGKTSVTLNASDKNYEWDWAEVIFVYQPIEEVVVDAVANYNNNELSKNNSKPTIMQWGDTVVLSATPTKDVTSIHYQWDNGTETALTGSTGTITIPTSFQKGSTHTLTITPYVNTKAYPAKIYYIYIPDDEITLSATFDGKTLSPNTRVNGEPGDPVKLNVTPEDNAREIVYYWDNDPARRVTVDGPIANLRIPEDFKPGTTHTLDAYAVDKKGKQTPVNQYIFVIPAEETPNDNLDILPWEKVSKDLQGVAISLRNDSESDKYNKNMYALKEKVTYYIDFKNAGSDINQPVTITFEVPLKFDIVDSDDGKVSQTSKTITWEYPNGLKQEYAGTKKVVLKYTAFSKSGNTSETIYPTASIAVNRNVKDSSSVINYIYKNSSTTIYVKHLPYMFGDANATTFRPDDTITRAEGALVLTRIIIGQDVIDRTTVSNAYSDITSTYLEAQKAITLATNYGILNGYSDGTYKPNAAMTRAEFMKIMAMFLEKDARDNNVDGLEVKTAYESVKLYNNPVTQYYTSGGEHWAIGHVSLLTRLNMTPVSKSEKDLRLDTSITRAEVAQFVNYYLLRAPASVTRKTDTGFSDVSTSHQLVSDIVEATREAHYFTITEDALEIAE